MSLKKNYTTKVNPIHSQLCFSSSKLNELWLLFLQVKNMLWPYLVWWVLQIKVTHYCRKNCLIILTSLLMLTQRHIQTYTHTSCTTHQTYRYYFIQSILYIKATQGNLYIKATQGNLKMWSLWAVALYLQVKIICTIH